MIPTVQEALVFPKTTVHLLTAALLATPAFAQEVPQQSPPAYNSDFEPSCEVAPGMYGKMSAPVTSKFNLSLGGFVKLDYVYNSVNLGNNAPALGTLQPAGIPKTSSIAGKQDQSVFTARQSRLWFKAAGPTLLGARTGALIETDFYGSGGSNESGNMRMRHAYGTMDWENTQLLFGQYWDNFGPASASTLDFGLGATAGNPQQPRVAQLRITRKVRLSEQNGLKLSASLQNPVQYTNQQSGATTDSWGSIVNVAGQAMFTSTALGTSPGFWGLSMNTFQTGLFGLYGTEDVGGNSQQIDSWGYGAYAFVPILASKDGRSRAMTASFEAQAYQAANMSFNYATAAAQVGPSGDKTGAKGYGLFGQAMFYPTQNLGFTAGYGRRNAYDYAAYAAVKNFQKSSSQVFANVAYDLNAAIRIAAEYQYLTTRYGNVDNSGTGNLAGTSDTGAANVFRFSMFYFF